MEFNYTGTKLTPLNTMEINPLIYIVIACTSIFRIPPAFFSQLIIAEEWQIETQLNLKTLKLITLTMSQIQYLRTSS